MSEVIKTATRDAYGKALVELGNTDAKVLVLDADLAAATKTGMFKKEHPEKFIDCGIAEGNMMGIAAGLAASGYTVFASSLQAGLPLASVWSFLPLTIASTNGSQTLENSEKSDNVSLCLTPAGNSESGTKPKCLIP